MSASVTSCAVTHECLALVPDTSLSGVRVARELTRLIAECEELIELFQGIDREVEGIVAPQRAQFGITPEWIEEHVALMEAEALGRIDIQDSQEA